LRSIVVDANVILRYLLEDNELFFEKSKILFDKALKGEIEIIVKQIILAEVVYVLEKVYKVSKEEISEVLIEFLLSKGIKIENKEISIKALNIYKNKNIDFSDAILCAMSDKFQIKTFDKKLNKCIKARK